ncbi:MAG: hypothetical protein HWD60_05730 [Defluviicoccus sp.]|nr:MAG: hypothetical protein HWD60_05730 [Defluviicoccus sp.]
MFQLQDFPFTPHRDVVNVHDDVTIGSSSADPVTAIINEMPGSSALTGDDAIYSILNGTVAITDAVTLSGLRNLDTIFGNAGSDTILGRAAVLAHDNTLVAAAGLDNGSPDR